MHAAEFFGHESFITGFNWYANFRPFLIFSLPRLGFCSCSLSVYDQSCSTGVTRQKLAPLFVARSIDWSRNRYGKQKVFVSCVLVFTVRVALVIELMADCWVLLRHHTILLARGPSRRAKNSRLVRGVTVTK